MRFLRQLSWPLSLLEFFFSEVHRCKLWIITSGKDDNKDAEEKFFGIQRKKGPESFLDRVMG
ncbi:MAG: hypothetical protein XD80_1277 [Synergistales bacterium 53_16]|nr:MAG: hypothetical protein XD80_1277 [Synergistales bacterium 53_16]